MRLSIRLRTGHIGKIGLEPMTDTVYKTAALPAELLPEKWHAVIFFYLRAAHFMSARAVLGGSLGSYRFTANLHAAIFF